MSGVNIPKNTWMNDANVLAQIGHALGGFSIIALATIFWGFAPAWWIAWTMLIAYAGIKEYVYDANYELPKQTFADNTTDFIFYQVGAGIGVLVMWLAHHLHRIG